mgnify:CR=1 FL=1
MLRRSAVPGVIALACQSLLYGQASVHRPEFQRQGKSVLILTPVNPADSLARLVAGSELIIGGRVSSTQQPIRGNLSARQVTAEAHAVVSVNSVLKGVLPEKANSVLVAQVGGRSGDYETVVERDRLLADGSRYILFLQADDRRTDIVNNTGLNRYGVVGVWSGKAAVLDGKIQFLPGVSKGLAEFNGLDVHSFSQRVKDLAAGKYISPKDHFEPPLPPHPPRANPIFPSPR